MKHISLLLAAVIACAPAQAQEKKTERKPNPVTAPIQDVAGLPRVLLIGDSISMGYTIPVRKLLEDKANVHRIPTNGGPTKNGVANLDKWLGKGKWPEVRQAFDEFFAATPHTKFESGDGKCYVGKPA